MPPTDYLQAGLGAGCTSTVGKPPKGSTQERKNEYDDDPAYLC